MCERILFSLVFKSVLLYEIARVILSSPPIKNLFKVVHINSAKRYTKNAITQKLKSYTTEAIKQLSVPLILKFEGPG